VRDYLGAVFPLARRPQGLGCLTDQQVEALYDSLAWYYLPLARPIDPARRGGPLDSYGFRPLAGPWRSASTQAFIGDGADCGSESLGAGSFTCNIFSQAACPGWEFGLKAGHGRPYQAVTFVQPYGVQRHGNPSYSWIESVAFACEVLGRQLLNAGRSGDSECSWRAPTWQEYLGNPRAGLASDWAGGAWAGKEGFGAGRGGRERVAPAPPASACPSKKSCAGNAPGCPYKVGSFTDICCWDPETQRAAHEHCPWPQVCAATGPTTANWCGTPCGYAGCDPEEGCEWMVDGQPWADWLKAQQVTGATGVDRWWAAYALVMKLASGRPYPAGGTAPGGAPPGGLPPGVTPAADVPNKHTMFYWLPGYGKFLNMGKTGIFFVYHHLLLTCPKTAQRWDGTRMATVRARWSFPQTLAMTLAGGTAESGGIAVLDPAWARQLADLMAGANVDPRPYLDGFVTTLRGPAYEGAGGVEVPNQQLHRVENPLLNPQDDPNLKDVAALTVTKYYDPSNPPVNPQFMKPLVFTPYQAVMLLQAFHIYGASPISAQFAYGNTAGTSMRLKTWAGVPPGQAGYPAVGEEGSGVWPFGIHHSGSSVGGCVYQLTALLGWDSAQFTQMPTGAGTWKACIAPEADYEIVVIQDKDALCRTGFKLLDPIQDYDNYSRYGFVQGSRAASAAEREAADERCLALEPFSAAKMPLTERNVPDDWQGPLPNATRYRAPSDPVYPDSSVCPYPDDTFYRYWQECGGINRLGGPNCKPPF